MESTSNYKTTHDQPPTNKCNRRTVSNALFNLWEKSADRLTTEELEWFADFAEIAENQAHDLSEVVMGLGCLITNDEQSGNFSNRGDVGQLLFNISNQIDTITGMIHIADCAVYRLRNPASYGDGNPKLKVAK